jgi:magnesium-protoporphyrin O-methyltransferase
VSDCCSPKGYRQVFSESYARSEARRYRRRGLDRTARRMVELLKDQDLKDRTLLEVGGGVGAIALELLKAGVSRAVSVELTPTYEEAATDLLREAHLEDRIERRLMDFAEAGPEVEMADLVVMNRVICCYPDMPKLAGAAADHARAVLVMSFPNERWWTRLGLMLGNLGLRITRRQFQVFLHPPDLIVATAERHGFRTRFNDPGRIWQVAALERVS